MPDSIEQALEQLLRDRQSLASTLHDDIAQSLTLAVLSLKRMAAAPPQQMALAALDGDDRLEHWLTRVAAEITYQITGDESARREIKESQQNSKTHTDTTLFETRNFEKRHTRAF